MDKKLQWALVIAVWVLVTGLLILGGWGLCLYRQSCTVGGLPVHSAVEIPDRDICPVTKQRIEINENTPRVRYQGRDFYFAEGMDVEGRSFKTLFIMDPEYYLNGGKVTKDEKTSQDQKQPLP